MKDGWEGTQDEALGALEPEIVAFDDEEDWDEEDWEDDLDEDEDEEDEDDDDWDDDEEDWDDEEWDEWEEDDDIETRRRDGRPGWD